MASAREKAAWALFGEGRQATSPEVKALGLRPSTTHRYYWEWKLEGKPKIPTSGQGGEDLVKLVSAVDNLTTKVSKQGKGSGKSAKTTAKKSASLPGGEAMGMYEPMPGTRDAGKKLAASMEAPAELDREIARIEKEEGYGEVAPPSRASIDSTGQEGEADVAQKEEGKEAPPSRPKIDFDLGGDHDGKKAIPGTVIGAGLPVSVTLSLKTLSFYELASTMQSGLTLGDFLDQCAEDFFTGRGRDLGLIEVN